VRIVLQPLDLARHTVLVAQEIDQPVLLLVAVATMAHRLPAVVVTRPCRMLGSDQRAQRAALVQVRARDLDLEASSRRSRFCFDQCHGALLDAQTSTPASDSIF